MNSGNGHEVPEEELPVELRAALRRRYGGTPEIPGNRDAQILREATLALAARTVIKQGRGHRGWWITASVTTTAVALLVLVMVHQSRPNNSADMVALNDEAAGAGSDQSDFPADESYAFRAASSGGLAGESLEPPPEANSDDIDGDGVVDILDAFAMARHVKNGDPDLTWDRNGDGVVDQEDVDHLARSTVTL